MKTTYFVFVFLFLNFLIVRAQGRIFDEIKDTDILIKNTRNHSWSLGSADELQKAYGKALVTKHESETSNGYYYLYEYQGLKVSYTGIQYDYIVITKSLFRLFLDDIPFKVRDNINKLGEKFPDSFNNKEENEDSGVRRIRIDIKSNNLIANKLIIIDYNKRGVIKRITIGKSEF